MRSHWLAGQVKLRGKRVKALACRCCVVEDLRPGFFASFWRKEVKTQADTEMRSRAIDRSAKVDDFGDTYWPDSDFLYD